MTEPDETVDELLRGRMRLVQPRRGFRVTMDPLLLLDFALATGSGRVGAGLDLGCGSGVLAVGLALADARARVVGVELLPELAALARRNAALNQVADRVEILDGDLARPRTLPLATAGFTTVVANPPYFAVSGKGGGARQVARQETASAIGDVTAGARRWLKDKGRFCAIFPAERTAELLAALDPPLRPRHLRFVHSVAGEPARRVLLEAVQGWRGGQTVLAPLVVHQGDRRSYTEEAATILGA